MAHKSWSEISAPVRARPGAEEGIAAHRRALADVPEGARRAATSVSFVALLVHGDDAEQGEHIVVHPTGGTGLSGNLAAIVPLLLGVRTTDERGINRERTELGCYRLTIERLP